MKVVFTQHFRPKKDLELFGDKADVAVQKELEQIPSIYTYAPVYKSDLTFEDWKKALASLFFITEKRNGDTKARNVADDSK